MLLLFIFCHCWSVKMNRTTQVDRNSVYSICRHTSSSCIVEIHAALQRHLAAKRNYSVWLDLDLCRHVGRQHLGQLVVLQAALEELLLRQVPVLVLVHPANRKCQLITRINTQYTRRIVRRLVNESIPFSPEVKRYRKTTQI